MPGPLLKIASSMHLYIWDPRSQLGGSIQGTALSLTSTVTTLAGSGTLASTDGTGTAASFNFPQDIATDGTSIYITDNDNHR